MLSFNPINEKSSGFTDIELRIFIAEALVGEDDPLGITNIGERDSVWYNPKRMEKQEDCALA